jgi:protein-tyrosine-phosphatase
MKDHRSPEKLPNGFKHLDQWYSKFLQQFPQVARNVFIMIPFTTPRTDQIYKTIVRAIEHYGLIPLRADLKTFVPVLWWNIQTYMVGSSYGIVIYEPDGDIPFNPNVSIEAGFMLALDHQVLLLANQKLDRLPVDFSGHVYRRFDENDLENSVYRAVSDWVTRDISYVDYGDKKLIVFVSLGGTCRCVMAKAILEDRLYQFKLTTTVAVEAAAAAEPHHTKISASAVNALDEIKCAEWVENHRPRKLSPYLQDRADLIITLTDGGLSRPADQPDKVITDLDLFGRRITNPYPDDEDAQALEKYRAARREIETAIDGNLNRILDLAGARPKI